MLLFQTLIHVDNVSPLLLALSREKDATLRTCWGIGKLFHTPLRVQFLFFFSDFGSVDWKKSAVNMFPLDWASCFMPYRRVLFTLPFVRTFLNEVEIRNAYLGTLISFHSFICFSVWPKYDRWEKEHFSKCGYSLLCVRMMCWSCHFHIQRELPCDRITGAMWDALDDGDLRYEYFLQRSNCFSIEIGVAAVCFSVLLFRILARGCCIGSWLTPLRWGHWFRCLREHSFWFLAEFSAFQYIWSGYVPVHLTSVPLQRALDAGRICIVLCTFQHWFSSKPSNVSL